MDDTPPAAKSLPHNPSIEHLRKQAKDLAANDPSLKLAAAQHRIAKEYGFNNWAALAQAVRNRIGDPTGPCQHCGKAPAVVHTTLIVAGKTFRKHFCDQCANDPSVQLMGVAPSPVSTSPQVPKPFVVAAKAAQTRLVAEAIYSHKLWIFVRDLLLNPLSLSSEQQSEARQLWEKVAKTIVVRTDMAAGESRQVATTAYREFLSILTPEQMEILRNSVLPPTEPPERKAGS